MNFTNNTSAVLDGHKVTDVIPFELISQNRNRSISKNPFLFEATLNNTGQKNNGIESFDPVTNQLPVNLGSINSLNTGQLLLEWTGLDVNVTGTITTVNFNEIIVSFTSSFDVQYNYYRGLIGYFSTGTWGHITEYISLGNNLGLFRIDNLPSTLPTVGSVFTVTFNGLLTATASNIFSVFVPKTMEHNALSGLFLYNETLNDNKLISTYSAQRAEALISTGPVPTWTNAHAYSVRKELPFLSSVASATTTMVTLIPVPVGTGAPGDFIRNRTTGEIVTIVTIDNATGVVTISPAAAAPWVAGQVLEILAFNRDNFNYITFSSLQREAPTGEYEATLISLNLPKERLDIDFPIEKMPFVYLEIRDTFNPSTNSFMSNNPGSKKALFKATLKSNKTDDKPFVKFSGDRAIRTLKFRPSAANFIFSILGPNGKPLMLWRQDTNSPYPPNRLLQAEAFINIRKISNSAYA
jgi:hypothetical protein